MDNVKAVVWERYDALLRFFPIISESVLEEGRGFAYEILVHGDVFAAAILADSKDYRISLQAVSSSAKLSICAAKVGISLKK